MIRHRSVDGCGMYFDHLRLLVYSGACPMIHLYRSRCSQAVQERLCGCSLWERRGKGRMLMAIGGG